MKSIAKIVRKVTALGLSVLMLSGSMIGGLSTVAQAAVVPPPSETVKVYESDGVTQTAEGKKYLDLVALYSRTYSQANKDSIPKNGEDWAENDDPKARSMFHGSVGDCTAFVSRALAYAGALEDSRWNYFSPNDRTSAWGGVSDFKYYLESGTGSFQVTKRSHTQVSDSTLRRGDIISTYDTATGACVHTMVVCADIPTDGQVVIAASNGDRQYKGKAGINWALTGEWGTNAYSVYRITSYKRAVGTEINMIKDGRADYGYGKNGQMAYAVDTSVNPYLPDQGESNAPITVPKLMSKDGKTLYYCLEYEKMHPMITSYVSSGTKVTDENVAFVLCNGWTDDSESIADYNARINSLNGASGSAVQCQYEGYYATQLAIWRLQGNSQIAKLTADKIIDTRSPLGHGNLDVAAAERVWNASTALMNAAKNKGDWSSNSSQKMTADVQQATGWDKVVKTIGGTEYIVVGPYKVTANKTFDDAEVYTNNANAKVAKSLSASDVASAKQRAVIDGKDNFYIVVPTSSKLNEFTVSTIVQSNVRHNSSTIWMYQSSDHASSQQKVAGMKPDMFWENATDSERVELFGWIEVFKTDEFNKPVANVEFSVYSDKACTKLVTKLVTKADGKAVSDGLTPGTYWVKETKADNIYVIDTKPYTATVVSGQTSHQDFVNALKKWKVTVNKVNADTNSFAEGDATLEGAVYGIFKDGERAKTVDGRIVDYTTDGNGQFTTDYYYCGTGYEVREITPSVGYKLDTTAHKIGTNPGDYTLEYSSAPDITSYEQPIKGMAKIIKHCDDGNTGIDTPEVGAEFQIYLKSAGSFENARESERDVLVIDANGNGISQATGGFGTKWMPYGTYTIHQSKCWEGKEQQPDFDVVISTDGQVSQFILNDATIARKVKIVKEDAESGKTVPLAGFTFKIKNVETGEFVVQHMDYPTPIDIDEFTTNSEGWLLLPQKLAYGKYQLIEVKAAPPYTLNNTPVDFVVDDSTEKNEPIIVKMQDTVQKGRIEISKTGILFDGVRTSETTIEWENIYNVIRPGEANKLVLEKSIPTYGKHEISGTEFDIIAAEDIVTPDGVLHAKKGEVVDHVMTNTAGKAMTKDLYLGKYIVTETKASQGQVNSHESHEVELVYAGQNAAVTTASTAFENVRQQVVVSMKKFMETNDVLNLGLANCYQNVYFGIYAAEDIKLEYSANGDMTGLKKDALLDVKQISEDGTLAFDAELPIGSYYVKEIATDGHYVTDETKYPVSFAYQGDNVEAVIIEVNDGNEIVNKLGYGNIEGLKKDEFGNLQAGAVFGLFPWNTEDFSEENALMTAESDENGVFRFEHVVAGAYCIKELSATDGFLVNDEIFAAAVRIDETCGITKLNGDDCDNTIINKVVRGNAAAIKVDADYPDNKLTGAEWEIYVDVNHNGIYDEDIDVLVSEENQGKLDSYTMVETELGEYVIEGLVYGDYLLKETKAPIGFFLDENYYAFSITAEGETVFVENEAGVGFTNKAMEGQLILIKKDAATGKPLEGVEISVFDEDGNLVATGISDKDGMIVFAGLRIGKYYYQETKALNGYVLDDTKYEFEIVQDNQIIEADIYNTEIEIPKTGDMASATPFIPFVLMLAAVAVITGTVIIPSKKRKSEEQ